MSNKTQILGKWKDKDGSGIYEFFSDETFSSTNFGGDFEGMPYSISGREIRMGRAWNGFDISGNTLSIYPPDGGSPIVFERVGSYPKPRTNRTRYIVAVCAICATFVGVMWIGYVFSTRDNPRLLPTEAPTISPVETPTIENPSDSQQELEPAGSLPTENSEPKTEFFLGRDIMAHQLDGMDEYPANGSFNMGGASYNNGVANQSSATFHSGDAYYNIGRQYTNLSGVYGPISSTGTDGGRTLNIYGDGVHLLELRAVTGDMPKPFSVDVTGVEQIRINISNHSGGTVRSFFGVANLSVSNGDNPAILNEPPYSFTDNAKIGADIKAFALDGMDEYPANGSFNMGGASYNNGVANQSSATFHSGDAYYNIGRQYTNLSGVYGPISSTGADGGRTLNIYGDGIQLLEIRAVTGDLPKPFSVDITGVKQLRINISNHSGSISRSSFGVANIVLSK
jgi:hypothetical protein